MEGETNGFLCNTFCFVTKREENRGWRESRVKLKGNYIVQGALSNSWQGEIGFCGRFEDFCLKKKNEKKERYANATYGNKGLMRAYKWKKRHTDSQRQIRGRYESVLFSQIGETASYSHRWKKCCITQSDVRRRGRQEAFTRTQNKEQMWREDTVPLGPMENQSFGKLLDARMHKRWPKIKSFASQGNWRGSHLLFNHISSNDSQIERLWIILQTNKLFKDELPSLLVSHFESPRPYLCETIANQNALQRLAVCAALVTKLGSRISRSSTMQRPRPCATVEANENSRTSYLTATGRL